MDELPLKTGPLRGPLRKRESHLWRRDPHDFYIEPHWCSERLFEIEYFHGPIWDPACGSGRIIRAAQAAGFETFASDIVVRHPDPYFLTLGTWWTCQMDFMAGNAIDSGYDIVSNPPFGVAEEFVSRALGASSGKVAMLLPANWVQGDKRSRWLEETPLRQVWFITPRPSMPPGTVIEAGKAPGNGTTDYAWFVWEHGYTGFPEIGWCRRGAPKLRLV